MRITTAHKFFSFALILLFSTIGFGKSEISKEKYEIYSAVINGVYATRPNKTSFLIRNYTVNDFEKLTVNNSYRKQLFALLPPLSLETVESYVIENEKESVLDTEFDLRVTYKLISRGEIEQMFKRGIASGEMEEWDDFHKKFPDVRNIIGLSQIGFNADKSQSLVYMDEWCGSLCGMGYYVLLEKENDKWKFIRQYSPWIS